MSKSIKISLSKDQFQDLLKLVYLGNWLINSIRSVDDQIPVFDDILDQILSIARREKMENTVDFDAGLKKHYPTAEFEDSLNEYIDEYDSELFWEGLLLRLVERDLIKKYGEDAVKGMSFDEIVDRERPFREKYQREFEQNGIENLILRY